MGKTCVERKVKVKYITESNAWHSIGAVFCLTFGKSCLVLSLFIAKQEMLGSGVVEVGRLFRNSFKNSHVRGHSVFIAAPPPTHTHTHNRFDYVPKRFVQVAFHTCLGLVRRWIREESGKQHLSQKLVGASPKECEIY
jgi:hypothetical protein